MSTSTTHTPPADKRSSRPAPPQWPVERLVARIGKVPAALGKFLDRLARIKGPVGWIVKFFSTVWVGIVFLILTGGYIAIGSGFASSRANLELTDLQFFDAWPMVTLLLLLATSLIVVTLRKIPLTIYKLGVWTVHIGILVMLTGCFIYFSQKVEGLTRIYLGQSTDCFYDSTERALYITRMDPDHPTQPAADAKEIMVPLPALPFFNEHLAVNPKDGSPGTPLNMTIAPETLAADPGLKGLGLTIVGYSPFVEMDYSSWQPGPATQPAVNPAIAISAGPSTVWLMGNSPAARVAQTKTLSLEFLVHPSPERLAALKAPFNSDRGIVVRIPKYNIDRTYPAPQDVPIAIEGTPYVLTPRETDASIPMVSEGYKDGPGDALIVDVQRQDPTGVFKFQRRALLYYPERSPDFTGEPGQQKRVQDRVDHDIDIMFVDATRDRFWIIQNIDGTLLQIHRRPGGAVESKTAATGDILWDRPGLTLTLGEFTPHAIPRPVAHWIPNEQRPLSLTATEVIQWSDIDMQVSTPQFRDVVPVCFLEFANAIDSRMDRQAQVVSIPGIGPVRLILSTTRRPLPSTLSLSKFEAKKYPGSSSMIEDYVSYVHVQDHSTHAQKDVIAHLNAPAEDNGLYLFQAQWDNPAARTFHTAEEQAEAMRIGPRYTVLGIGNRPGIPIMMWGAILMVTGVLYSFYLKPLLLNLRKAQLAAYAAKGAL